MGSSSTWAAGLNVMICWVIASLSAARSVPRMCCRVAGPVVRRNGGSWAIRRLLRMRQWIEAIFDTLKRPTQPRTARSRPWAKVASRLDLQEAGNRPERCFLQLLGSASAGGWGSRRRPRLPAAPGDEGRGLVKAACGQVRVRRPLGAAGAVHGLDRRRRPASGARRTADSNQGVRAQVVQRAEIPGCGAIKKRRWASYLDVKSRGC